MIKSEMVESKKIPDTTLDRFNKNLLLSIVGWESYIFFLIHE